MGNKTKCGEVGKQGSRISSAASTGPTPGWALGPLHLMWQILTQR